MNALYTTLLTIFKNTDIVLCEREGAYYVNMHFKDLEEEKKDKRFIEQWQAFQKWLATEASDKVVILMADFNTEISVEEQKIKFTSKKGYVFMSDCEKHNVSISTSPFYSTNKTRLFTAQFNKMYVVNTFRIDYVLIFTPEWNPFKPVETPTQQWTMEQGVFQPRTSEHEMELGFPSDHDPIIYDSYATWNTCYTGERFAEDESSTNSGESTTNTFEFIPAEYKDYFINKKEEIIELLTKELQETDLSKLAKKYNSERCSIFDIHLHPKDMPILYLDGDGDKVQYQHIDNTRVDLHRVSLWLETFYAMPVEKQRFYMPVFNTWQKILQAHQEVFSAWYEKSLHTSYLTKLDIVNTLLTKVNVIGLQEILPKDKPFLQKHFGEKIVFSPIDNFKCETIGAIPFR